MPEPRVTEGIALAECEGVHAMMDISDGIASDLRHILEASGVGAEIDIQKLPLSAQLCRVCEKEGWDAEELALEGGEDYELLFTMAPGTEPPVPHTVIGRITSSGLVWTGGKKTDYQGFRHF